MRIGRCPICLQGMFDEILEGEERPVVPGNCFDFRQCVHVYHAKCMERVIKQDCKILEEDYEEGVTPRLFCRRLNGPKGDKYERECNTRYFRCPICRERFCRYYEFDGRKNPWVPIWLEEALLKTQVVVQPTTDTPEVVKCCSTSSVKTGFGTSEELLQQLLQQQQLFQQQQLLQQQQSLQQQQFFQQQQLLQLQQQNLALSQGSKYPCPKCEKTFAGPSGRSKHMSSHEPGGHPCLVCGYNCPSKHALNQHMKRGKHQRKLPIP